MKRRSKKEGWEEREGEGIRMNRNVANEENEERRQRMDADDQSQ